MWDTDTPHESGDDTGGIERRTVLKGIGATAAIGTGATALSGSVAADITTADLDVIEVDESGFFFPNWEADGSLPVADELIIFIHGWFGDTTVESQAVDTINAVINAGYSPDETVAIEWPATNLNFAGAEGDTENVAEVVAGLIEDFYDAGGGNVRLTGHSLGGRTVCWVPSKLSTSYEVETVAALGAAADGSGVCPGGQWYDGIVENVADFRNYHSFNDSVVGGAYGGVGDTALGTEGANCAGANSYTDVDVTATVGGHLEYLGDATVGSDLATAIEQSDDGGNGGDGGDDCLFFC